VNEHLFMSVVIRRGGAVYLLVGPLDACERLRADWMRYYAHRRNRKVLDVTPIFPVQERGNP
jgi:hypothetical protein